MKEKGEVLLYLTFFFTVMPKYGSWGKRILSRNRRSSLRRRTRVRREGENGGSKQKQLKNENRRFSSLSWKIIGFAKIKSEAHFLYLTVFVYGYAEIRQPLFYFSNLTRLSWDISHSDTVVSRYAPSQEL